MLRALLTTFKVAFLLFALFSATVLALYFFPNPELPTLPDRRDFLIQGADIIDVKTGEIKRSMDVVVHNGIITQIGKSPINIPADSLERIPAQGKFLIPSLWDMHTHSLKLSPYIHHPLFISYGVTSIRDMSGCLDKDDAFWACTSDRQGWNQELSSDSRVTPRYHQQSSYQLNGGNEIPDKAPSFFRLNIQDDAKLLVDFYKSQGVHFIKTYSELSNDQFNWVSNLAQSNGVMIAGHKPITVPLEKALSVNMTSIEHGRLFAFECYSKIQRFRELENPIMAYTSDLIQDIILNQDTQVCDQLMNKMSESATHWTPTLTTVKMSADAQKLLNDDNPNLNYIPWIVKKLIWEPDAKRAVRLGFDKNGNYVHKDYYALVESQLLRANKSGVKILLGTDNIDSYVYSGLSVHHELQNLVNAGLSNLQALQSATIHAAEFSQKAHEYGSVEVGKHADLLILNANPLLDIRNSSSIEAVIFDGRLLNKTELDSMRDYVTNLASSIAFNLKYLANMILSPLMRKQLAD